MLKQEVSTNVYIMAGMDVTSLSDYITRHMFKQALGLQLSYWYSYFQNWHAPLLQSSFHAKHIQNVAIHVMLMTVADVLVVVNAVWLPRVLLHTR